MNSNAIIPKKDSIDYLKAFAIALVVTHHVITYTNVISFAPFMQTVLDLIQSVHVPLFFCIAGYLCHKQDLKVYFTKKIHRVFIPFLTFTILKLVYTTFISDEFAHAETSSDQIIDAFLNGSLYWFIYPILIFYLCAPLFWKLRKGNIIIFIGLILINAYLGNPTNYFLQLWPALFNACYFVAGIIIQQNEKQLSAFAQKHNTSIILLCAVTILSLTTLLYTDKIWYSFLVKTLLAFSEMYLLWTIAKKLPTNISILKVMGKYSLQIMFFDSFFKVILFVLIRQFATVNVLTAVLTIPANIFLGCISCIIIEKIPVIRKFFGL